MNYANALGSLSSPISLVGGGRVEISISAEYPNSTGGNVAAWQEQVTAVNSFEPVQYIGIYHVNDEPTYWTGQLVGTLMKARIAQMNVAVTRDLDLTQSNSAICTTWYTRRPSAYSFYRGAEMRTSMYAGQATYNSGTDTYSLMFGSGNWTDKQTIIGYFANQGTSNSKISLNGNAAVPLSSGGSALQVTPGNNTILNNYFSVVYDATLNVTILNGGYRGGVYDALNCGMPPEAFVEINNELNTNPWIVTFFTALDPLTDYYLQYVCLHQTKLSKHETLV